MLTYDDFGLWRHRWVHVMYCRDTGRPQMFNTLRMAGMDFRRYDVMTSTR